MRIYIISVYETHCNDPEEV